MKRTLSIMLMALLFVTASRAQGVSKMFGLVGGYPQSDNSSNGFLFSTDSSGQNFQLQYAFPVAVNGGNPANLEMVPYNGKLYGTTRIGGTGNNGTLFEYDPATNIYTKKFDFGTNFNLYGYNPFGSLLLYNNKFYGLTYFGGASGYGTIFEWDPATNVVTKKYDFNGTTGGYPQNSLRLMNGKMYGGTTGGGSAGLGVVFEWDPATNAYTDLLDMTGPGAGNGWAFYTNITPYNNKLYCGSWRGAANDAGALYVIDPALPNGSNTTVIKVFGGASSADGTSVNNNEMIVYNNKLYGTLYYNGAFAGGTLFELNPVGNVFTKLVDFNYTSTGDSPLGKLVANGSKFLGMCSRGGADGKGTIYEWDPASPNTVVKKYDFGISNYDNPINPGSTFTFFNSKFYATTYSGGFNDQGCLFEYDYAAGTVTKKLNFNTAENGRIPYGRPTLLNGKIYGTCATGPQPDAGCIWEYDPSTTVYSRKHNFDLPGYGPSYGPTSSPVAYNGKLYGTTGGSYGVFYEFDPATNIYTKKDFQPTGSLYPIGEPTLYNNKFYGMTSAGGTGNWGTVYSYDPATGILTNLYSVQNSGSNQPTGGFTVYNNKLYGATNSGGANNVGGIIMYDPATNTASTLFSLNGAATGTTIQNTMTVYNNKLYGNTLGGGTLGAGILFQFDPATNAYTALYSYDPYGDGGYPTGILTINGNKLYTITRDGNNIVRVVQFDPATNTATTRSSYTPASSYNLPLYHNALTVVPAFIANGIPGSCETYPTVVINGSNNNQWVPILNTAGDVVAEIKANGNNLGNVNASSYINNTAVREDPIKRLYMDRNLTITVQNQPASNVDIRLYVKTSEFLALKNATNSIGQPSGINTISDVAIFKNEQTCSGTLTQNAAKLTTVTGAYEYGYVLSASISSFSTFFFAKNTFTALPLTIINFDAVKQEQSVKLNWVTENEINVANFEVEKSSNASDFTAIGTVAAKGNIATNNYSINDNHPFAGVNYYRLKAIDKNSQFKYSGIVKVDFSKKYTINILPNPAKDYITINGADAFKQIQVIDVTGKVVKQMNKEATNRYNISGLNKGVYVIKLINQQEIVTSKIVIE
ncbi:choice-of-anchor tandem repeat GloVer-containing protein [Ferruginibacter sp. SUN106]|uniref:T9SS type A sorting domain-containing protein n=1 Tax=Ferruginibacter sp. SUN106 TaxID=2978348 RepID=UPI003D36F340